MLKAGTMSEHCNDLSIFHTIGPVIETGCCPAMFSISSC